MSDHLPECDSPSLSNTCICPELRACEQRVTKEIWGAIREGSQYKSGFEGGLDAAREAVERVSTLFEPLGPALAAIDALREDKK